MEKPHCSPGEPVNQVYAAIYAKSCTSLGVGLRVVVQSWRTDNYYKKRLKVPLPGMDAAFEAFTVGSSAMNPFRGILMIAAAAIAFWRGWQIHHGQYAWMAYGLSIVALGLAVWHMAHAGRTHPE